MADQSRSKYDTSGTREDLKRLLEATGQIA